MNYEVQQLIDKKVDNWQFHALQQEVDRLKYENSELRNKLNHLEGRLNNHYSAIERLIQIMIDSEHFVEINQLYEIKQYL